MNDLRPIILDSIPRNTERESHRIFDLLKKLDSDFIPPISSYVDIEKYSKKLLRNAEILIAREEEADVGLIAFYANDCKACVAFITIIGILPEGRGLGLGKSLMLKAENSCKHMGMNKLRLEVSSRNLRALRLYEGLAYRHIESKTPLSFSDALVYEKQL